LKLKLVIIPFILLMLFRVDVQGQDSLEKLKNRARSFEPIIVAAANRYGVDANLLWTIAYLESRFDPRAVSYKDGRPCAFGLMQFEPATAQQYGLTNPHNPREAVDAAARHVRDLLKRFTDVAIWFWPLITPVQELSRLTALAGDWCFKMVKSLIPKRFVQAVYLHMLKHVRM